MFEVTDVVKRRVLLI